MLLQLGLDEPERQASPVNRDVDLLERVWQAADVVLMAVAQEDAEHVTALVQQVRDVGQDQVDAEHVLLGEHEAGVDDQDLVLPLEGPHVDADLAEAAERQILEARSNEGSPRSHGKASDFVGIFTGDSAALPLALVQGRVAEAEAEPGACPGTASPGRSRAPGPRRGRRYEEPQPGGRAARTPRRPDV